MILEIDFILLAVCGLISERLCPAGLAGGAREPRGGPVSRPVPPQRLSHLQHQSPPHSSPQSIITIYMNHNTEVRGGSRAARRNATADCRAAQLRFSKVMICEDMEVSRQQLWPQT